MSWKSIAALACWAASLAALALIFHAGHPAQAHLVHSDALYLPVLFEDLLERGGDAGDWFLPPAPYFFPDMLMYLPAWLAGDVQWQTLVFALLQTALTSTGLYLVSRSALPHSRMPAAATLSILFIWLGLNAGDPFVRLFASAHHYGAFLAALLLLALWLDLDARGHARPGKRAAAAAMLVFGVTLSDALFLAQTVLPLLLVALLYRQGAPHASSPRRTLALLFAPALLGMLSYRLAVAHPTRYPARLGFSRLSENLDEIGNICATLFGGRMLLAAALLLALGLGAACIVACLCRRPLPLLPRPLQLLAAFATVSCVATVGAMALSTSMQPVARYLIGALSWPLIAGMFALVYLLGSRFCHLGLALNMAFAGLLAVDAWRLREVRDTGRYYYPEQLACMDRVLAAAGASHGMAQYWDAKHLQALSRQRLTLAQYTGELDRMEWITSARFYRDEYDFAIIAEQEPSEFKLSRTRLVARQGEPAKAVSCGDRTVLLFKSSRDQ